MAVISSAEQRSDDELPVDVDALPTLDDALSAVNDALPAVDDTLPAVIDVLPAVNDVLPAVNDALPAVDDALPNDALPSVSQRRISASSWQRSASSAVNRSSSRPCSGNLCVEVSVKSWVNLASGWLFTFMQPIRSEYSEVASDWLFTLVHNQSGASLTQT